MRKKYTLIMILVVVAICAAVPRFFSIQHPGMTRDEQCDVNDALLYNTDGDWQKPISDGYLNGQFIYYVTDVLFEFGFPRDEITPRLVSALLGVVNVLLVTLLAYRIFHSSGIAFFTGMSAALSCFMISSSRLAFSHGHIGAIPFLLFSYLLLLYACEPAKTPYAQLKLCLLAVLSLGMAVGSDILILPIAVAPGILLLIIIFKMDWKKWVKTKRFLFLFLFLIVGLLGVGITSPMFLISPYDAMDDIYSHMSYWNNLTGYTWLGGVAENLPWYYYLVILFFRVDVPILVLFLASSVLLLLDIRKGIRCQEMLFLYSTLWVIIYFSLKGWKSPFYLSPVVPVIYIGAMYLPARLLKSRGKLIRLITCFALLAVLLSQLIRVWHTHPAYLMDGVQFSKKSYGQFQGPAVEHGQWMKEALEYIRDDSRGREYYLVIFESNDDVGMRQLHHYCKEMKIANVINYKTYHSMDTDRLKSLTYFLIYHPAVIPGTAGIDAEQEEANRPLYEYVQTPPCSKVASIGHYAYPIIDVYKIKDTTVEISQKEAENIVNNCFFNVLQRPPDTQALQVYSEHIVKGKDSEWLTKILRKSDEYEKNTGRRHMRIFTTTVLFAILTYSFMAFRKYIRANV